MPKNVKPYNRPATNLPVAEERSKQFKAASRKFGKRVNEPEKNTKLVEFANITLNYEATPEMKQRMQNFVRDRQSIFNKYDVTTFIANSTFVAAFAHPTYEMEYNKIFNTNNLKIYCKNINKKLLFKNENFIIMNLLPDVSAFRVQINDKASFIVQSVIYEDNELIVTINLSPDQARELLPLSKCIIYLNILYAKKEWKVPPDLMLAFTNLPLAEPKSRAA